MRERVLEVVVRFGDDLGKMGDVEPAVLYDLITEYQGKLEGYKNELRDVILAKKKEEYFRALMDKKNLGIR